MLEKIESIKALEKLQSLRMIIKNSKSTFYYLITAVIIFNFVFFYNIKSFLPDASSIFNTPLNTKISLGSTQISIKNWQYNQLKNFMEIELYYDSTSIDSATADFKFSARARSDISKKLSVKTIINVDSTYILHIKNIPRNFGAIALTVSESSTNDDVSTDNFDANNFNDADLTSDSVKDSVKLYTDHRTVKYNNKLKTHTQKEYMTIIAKDEIKSMEDSIVIIDKYINKNKKLISTLNKKIDNLKQQYKYEIKEDQKNTTDEISNYKLKIGEISTENDDLIEEKKMRNEKIEKLQLKIKDINNEG